MPDISQHFSRKEFECSCGCGFDTVDALLLEALEAIREHFSSPTTVTSGCRCPAYNNSIGGVHKSQHIRGRAADIQVKDVEPSEVAKFAEELGMSVGSYNTFTHVDSRTGPTVKW